MIHYFYYLTHLISFIRISLVFEQSNCVGTTSDPFENEQTIGCKHMLIKKQRVG